MSRSLAIIAGNIGAVVTCVQVMPASSTDPPYGRVYLSLFSLCQSSSLDFKAADYHWKKSDEKVPLSRSIGCVNERCRCLIYKVYC